MKRLVPVFHLGAILALTACSTPEQRAAEHQRELQAEAREKFDEQKQEERERAEDASADARKRTEDVVDARRRGAEDAARYRAYEEEYARQLGKKPSQLTPAERAWVRDH